MRGFLSSPRRRRRLAKAGVSLAVVTALAGLVIWDPGGIDPTHEEAAPPGEAPALTRPRAEPFEPLRLTRESRRELDATVRRFVATAVTRRDVEDAWSLASEEMRAGISRRDWSRGDIPVQPYPAQAIQAVDWRMGYVDRDAVIVDVMIQPKQGSGERVQVFSVQLSREGGDDRWLVDSWIPVATLGTADPPTRARGERPGAGAPLAFDDARLSAWWFLAPALFLALLVLTPLVLVVRGVRSRRRAERAYRAWKAEAG